MEPIPEYELNNNGSGAFKQEERAYNQEEQTPTAGSDLLSSLATSYARPVGGTSSGVASAKKRKLNAGDDFPDLGGDAMDGLDADVAEMLRRESGNAF